MRAETIQPAADAVPPMSDFHGHGHGHGHSGGPVPVGPVAAKVVIGLLVVIGIAVLIGAIALWPSKQDVAVDLPFQSAQGGVAVTEAGTVTMQNIGPCGSSSAGRAFTGSPVPPPTDAYECQRSIVDIESGPNAGTQTLLEIIPGPGQPDLRVGESIRLSRQTDVNGTTEYSFEDYARGWPVTLIALTFAVVVIVVARWRGLRALVGIVVSFGVLVLFMLPALLDGKPAIPVALVSGAIILYAVLYLAHGVSLRTSSALLGTLASMLLAAVLSYVTIVMTQLTGLSEEQNTNVQAYIQHVSITGLLLAGFIIGSLGVLNDVTITQAASAFELASLDPDASRRQIFGSAMRVGRDHIASTVYTLVLAYAGGALPLLLVFSVAGRSIQDVLLSDAVSIEIVRSAVGGIALALSVPLTTAIAVVLARPLGSRSGGNRNSGRGNPQFRTAAPSRGGRHSK
ncbi:YibE/F family membrane protein [Rhodococcus sp. WAY2]|nr:YibE/F family membrane protein [Rhodococcus sp. WAY2]